MQYREDSINSHSSKLDADIDMQDKNKKQATKTSERKNVSSRSLIVVKIGGSTFGSDDTTVADLVKLQKQGFQPVVVHGGGKVVSDWLKKQGIRPKFIRGLRVTDQNTLDVVVGVLTGVVNKNLVGEIILRGGRAVGLSGVDGGILQGDAENPELGFVGTIKKVDVSALLDILDGGSIPVLAPVAIKQAVADDPIQLLNINADIAAGEVAAALKADRLIMLTDVPGVLDSSRRVIQRLTQKQAKGLVESNIVAGGMVPKLESCIKALQEVKETFIVDGRKPHILLECFENDAGSSFHNGTRVG
ncbi:MAG: acetylglutamate kinase [Dehalococcoidia bacterium]|nr:acetylglutamate kinase [Dehalococcoidia bacterium]MQG15915.1 acetylglutamate kinase [SAR202 cluster bacterium]|tara:strand:+ start:5921 stop:6829 length:909 start_codon:yes stop_codon:yes gene_type:complete